MHSRFDMHTQAVPLWEKKAGDEIIMIANFVTGAKRQHNTQGHDDYEYSRSRKKCSCLPSPAFSSPASLQVDLCASHTVLRSAHRLMGISPMSAVDALKPSHAIRAQEVLMTGRQGNVMRTPTIDQ